MADVILSTALVVVPPAVALAALALFYLWLRRRRLRHGRPARKPRAAPTTDEAPAKPVPQTDEEVDSVIRELDEVSQKVLGESIVHKEK